MKNLKLRKCVALILTAFLLASCTDYLEGLYPIEKTAENSENQNENGDSENPQNPDTPTQPENPSEQTFTVSFSSNAEEASGETKSVSGKENEKVALTANGFTRDGYAFAGWNTKPDGSGTAYTDGAEITLTENLTLYAKWSIITYTISYTLNGGEWASSYTATTNYTVEDEFSISDASAVTRTGYGFGGWYESADGGTTLAESATTQIAKGTTGNKSFYAKWTEGAVNYTVWHLQQNIADDNYTLKESEAKTGTVGTQTQASAKSYEHFTAQEFSQKEILADGSTVIEIKYDRKTYAVTFSTDGGSVVATQTVRYEATASKPIAPTKTGYTFGGWFTSTDSGNTLSASAFDFDTKITAATTLYAKWEAASVNYTVRHLFQKVDASDYEQNASHTDETKSGKTGAQTQAEPKSVTGFTAQTVAQQAIAADGSTLVEIRYDRNTHTVTYADGVDSETISVPASETHRYGEMVTVNFASIGTRIGYTFSGWNDGNTTYTSDGTTSFTLGDSDVTLTAEWKNLNLATKDTIVELIKSQTESNTLYLSGLITSNTIQQINAALKELYETDSSIKISLDLSEAKNLNSLASAYYNQGESFYGCKNLSKIVLPDSVKSIGSSAFYGCSSLTDINIPDGVTSIGALAFCGCSSLTSINIPDGVTSIGATTFRGCSSLTSVNIPDSVTSIGNHAFYGCSSLISINIPVGITSIEEYTFYDCSRLLSVNIPDGVKTIGNLAFKNCSSLTSINIPDSLTDLGGNNAFEGCSSLTSLNIPYGVKKIGRFAFKDCSNLTNVIFQNTENWTVYNGTVNLSSDDLANSETAAEFLTNKYCGGYDWMRNIVKQPIRRERIF